MTESHTIGSGLRHAFAPNPKPIEDHLHRIHVIFEEDDGRVWSAGTDMIAPTLESAETFTDRPNASLDLDREAWSAFARRVFRVQSSSGPGPEPIDTAGWGRPSASAHSRASDDWMRKKSCISLETSIRSDRRVPWAIWLRTL